jgi:lipopolysaccharide export LptBFGC system permease protein LptF
MKGQPAQTFDPTMRAWIVGRTGAVYNYDRFDPMHGELDGLSMFEMDTRRWRIVRSTFTPQATYAPGADPSSGLWGARDAQVWEMSDGDEPRFATQSAECPVVLEPVGYFRTSQPDAELLSYAELRHYTTTLSQRGFNVTPYAVALQRKLSFPLTTMIMVLLAVPFGVTIGRRGALGGVGIGVLVAFAYWVASSTLAAIGNAGALSPVLAAWAPNVLFAAVAVYLVLWVRT